MRCTDFLTTYSDYRDDLIVDADQRDRVHRHLIQCPRCAQHDRVLRRGVALLRTDQLDLSHRSRVRLRVRIALANRKRRPRVFPIGAAAAMVAIAVGWGTIGSPRPLPAPAPAPAPVVTRASAIPVTTHSPLAVPEGYLPADVRLPPAARVYSGTYEPVRIRHAVLVEP